MPGGVGCGCRPWYGVDASSTTSTGTHRTNPCAQGTSLGEGVMHIVGLDHVVVNTQDIERAIHFYHEVLGLELLRLEAFRAGTVGFVSARVSPETLIDIRPIAAGERVTPNMDHYCLVLGPTDMQHLHAELQAKGIQVEETVRPAWGHRAMGSSSNSGILTGTRLSCG